MVFAQVSLNDYTNRVLGVVKAKFGLNDKSEALNKFVALYGDDLVEKEASDEYVKKVLAIVERDRKRHGNRAMTLKELDKLLGP